MSLMIVGVMAMRDKDGRFLAEKPIYREVNSDDNSSDYFSNEELKNIFAKKVKEIMEKQKK